MKKPRPCHANHCRWVAEPGKLMCITHWRLLPGPMQGAILQAYRASPTRAQRLSSVPYLEACADAVEYIATKEGHLTRNAFRSLANLVKSKELKTCQ